MDVLRIAIATNGLESSLRNSIDAAALTGASGVQFDLRTELTASQFGETACQQLRHLLGERSLQVASTTFPLRRPLYDPVEIDGRVQVIKDAILLSGRLKSRVLTFRVGRIPSEQDFDNRARLRELAAQPSPPRVTIFHGTADEVIPFKMGRTLGTMFPKITTFHAVPDATHDSIVYNAAPEIFSTMNQP